MKRYNPSELEPKWQQIWRDERRYAAADQSDKPKYYVTGMFPYPSGAGMHTGHFFEHSIVDAVARFRRTLGYNVMYPMGFDNFGLPAENYAIKTGRTPQETTAENIASFTNQLRRIGASIDWDREVRTSDPEYYRWTQWIFTQLFERGLAYQKEANQWWCPKDKTVLANEQVISGRCWRCEELVVKKPMKQWFFKITDYADSLLAEIPALDWPDKIKTAQENWIGRSQGAEIEFVVAHDTLAPSSLEAVSRQVSVEHAPAGARAADVSEDKMSNSRDFITVFTTRPDTIFGATFLVLAPEHPLVSRLVTDDTREAVEGYVAEAIKKSEIERSSEGKDKTGVFTGSYAINPASGERMPIWVADYVLWGYGTGAIMAVPAHDERDFSFAVKFDLPIIRVVTEDFGERLEDAQTVSGSVVIVYDDATKKFLGVKTGTSDGIWLNGGGREEGESFEQTAIRELREETGFATYKEIHELGEPVFSYYFNDVKKMAKRSFGQGFLFVVDATDQAEAAPEEHEKSFEFGWYDYDDLIAGVKDVGGGVEHWLEMLARAKKIIDGEEIDRCYHGEGTLINSGVFDGIATSDAREQIVAWLEQENRGRAKVTYKMRDWLISRQRYWGAPIPIIHCNEHGAVAVPADQLPVLLPEVSDFVPRGDGKSVLGAQEDWVNTACPTCGKPAKRETDTMDGYACSSWYLLRYTDPHNDAQAWSPEIANYWAPLDMYVGGDHAVAHLLYVRFWTHVFHDMGLVDFKEPVKKLVYHGLIQAEDGRKMSKSLGNVVDPLEVIDAGYGADALRTFELFLGPIDENSSWNSRGIAGVYRFLNRVWTLTQEYIESAGSPPENRKRLRAASQIDSSSLETRAADVSSSPEATLLASLTHVAIKKVTDDINRLSFNTAIAAMMELVNELYKLKLQGFSADWQFTIESLVQLLQPFAPHMSAELWQQLGHDTPLDTESWPAWDDTKIVQDTMTIIVQVNGKLRAKLEVAPDETEETIKKLALADENVQKFVTSEPRKVIYVKGKLVSVVV